MMSNLIQALSEDCINQIAAGEVIERPASVVKELVENALDAGATSIEVRLLQGGILRIEVADNGKGMSPEDLEICYLRYTTSKLSSPQEIFSVLTNGFRGEALSSIAAVSRLTLQSKRPEQDLAWSKTIEGGIPQDIAPFSKSNGTTLIVQDLFYNTPVRKKFLASASTEHQKIVDVVTRISLAHPEVFFSLENDGKEVLHLNQGTLAQRITQIFGAKTSQQMKAVSYQDSGCELYGFVGDEGIASQRRLKQYFYLDHRPVESFQISKALERAWQSFFPGKHPPAVLFLSMPRDEYDINVHPTKKEIRFSKPEEAFSIIYRLIRRALDEIYRPQSPFENPAAQVLEAYPLSQDFKDFEVLVQTESPPVQVEKLDLFASSAKQVQFQNWERPPETQHSDSYQTPEKPLEDVRIFQWSKSFLVAEMDSALLIVDQYNAHVRILFDRSLHSLNQAKCMASQQLLFPEVLEFSPEESAVIEEFVDLFYLIAFDLEPFGKNAFRLRGIPTELPASSARSALKQLIEDLCADRSHQSFKEKLALSFARSTAIRRGQVLNQEEMNSILFALFASSNPYVCPKGKSIFHRIPAEDMERKFF